MQKTVIDTNVLLANANVLDEYQNIIIPVQVLEELDGLKKADGETGFKARRAINKLNNSSNVVYAIEDDFGVIYTGWDIYKRDNQIVFCALKHNATLISNDICMIEKAKSLGINTSTYNTKTKMYLGYQEFSGDTDYINYFFESRHNCLDNEYIILHDTSINKTYEYRYFDGDLLRLVLPSKTNIKGLNSLQRCAIDLMNNNDIPIKIILGGFGSGKTYLSVQMALLQLNTLNTYSKILCIREPIGEGKEIGFLKGSKEDKTADFFKPFEHSLEGGEFELQTLIKRGQLEREVPYFVKGCTYNNTIILCDEAEDIKYKQLKLIGTRLGKNSCIYLIGDYKQSTYDVSENNGLIQVADKLKGNASVGVITLNEDVRSKPSKIFADLD